MRTTRNSLSDYLKSLYAIHPLTHEEEIALSQRIQQGDEYALEKLVTHNLRFVVSTIKQTPTWQHSTVPMEDLLGYGNEALIDAAKKWIPKNNARFVTYAKKFIIRGVERGLDNTENLVRIPIKVREEIRKMTYTERALKQTLMRPPTVAELAEILGKPVKRVNQLKFYLMQEPTSLDALNLDKLEEDGDE